MNAEQVANFAYWLTETTNLRGADKYKGKQRVAFIQHMLIPEFMEKYPNGTLGGWTKPMTPFEHDKLTSESE